VGRFRKVVVQSLSHARLFVTPWSAARQASLFFTISQSLLKLMSLESVMPSNHLILCHSLLLLPSVFSDGQSIGASASAITFNEVSLITRRRQSWSPDLTCHPAYQVASDFSVFAQ